MLAVLAGGAGVGLINGLLVEVAQIDSFIATLGTGTVLYTLALWHTGGKQMIGMLPPACLNINAWFVLGLPITALYVVALAIILWLVTERMPIGRQLYAIGASPKAAPLNGIPVRRYVILSFVASGFLTACTGVILASKLRIGQAGVGLEYLLPALVGVFLGSTTIKPGRVNAWGTVVAVLVRSAHPASSSSAASSMWSLCSTAERSSPQSLLQDIRKETAAPGPQPPRRNRRRSSKTSALREGRQKRSVAHLDGERPVAHVDVRGPSQKG